MHVLSRRTDIMACLTQGTDFPSLMPVFLNIYLLFLAAYPSTVTILKQKLFPIAGLFTRNF
jgi:hypothetical protein